MGPLQNLASARRTRWYLLAIVILTGCADNPYRAIYEGIKQQQEAQKSPRERTLSTPLPSYDAYRDELERKNRTTP